MIAHMLWALREYTRQLHSTQVYEAAGVHLTLAVVAFAAAGAMTAPWWFLLVGLGILAWGVRITL